MNKTDFEKWKLLLKEQGYREYDLRWHSEDYMLGKTFHRDDNRWNEDRSGCLLLLCIYDYTLHPEWYDKIPKEHRDHVGIDIRVDVSRIIDERMELTANWRDDMSIEDAERLAESFYQWVCKEYPEPVLRDR